MTDALDPQNFTGAHPTARDFLDQLLAWGFLNLGERGPHIACKAPGGGRVKLLRSLAGRADATQVAKAARYLDITIEQFWAGPDADTTEPDPDPFPVTLPEPAAAASPPPRRRRGVRHDSDVAVVYGIHINAGKPMAFDEVVTRTGGRLTRGQVATASATLCQDGQLDRIRRGIYQRSSTPRPADQNSERTAVAEQLPLPRAASTPAPVPSGITEADVLERLFPDGVTITAADLPVLQQVLELATKLVNH